MKDSFVYFSFVKEDGPPQFLIDYLEKQKINYIIPTEFMIIKDEELKIEAEVGFVIANIDAIEFDDIQKEIDKHARFNENAIRLQKLMLDRQVEKGNVRIVQN